MYGTTKLGVFAKQHALTAIKSEKAIFEWRSQSRSQSFQAIDLDVIWKGLNSGVCEYDVSISRFKNYSQYVILKVDNRRTDKQTEKKQYDPIITFRSIQISLIISANKTLMEDATIRKQ